ncbi:Gfo/Idh/MocA family protein [Nonomuraea jiangxiensis]|uniref:Predicted dehydrogenase n=1 Tax=Nonomuraea jiangxiensis TaxID=633440 RepID=A0A1G9FDD5_9ACTN|nr:Gfo/Idh/MocA family oxidoreductase [Nonomuraea jiangxiensis]SDK86425.1 Predicted dehydrogenase [Nonomuraea jiangxiensis]
MTGAPLRLGVLGLGAVAQAVHLPLLAKRRDLYTIAAVADLSAEVTDLVGDRFGVPGNRRFHNLTDLLDAGDLDAVMILARGSHAPEVRQVFERGLPVFCEKPLAYTLAEIDDLAGVGGRILLGYMKQYDPAVIAAERALAGVDDIRSIEATVLHPTGASQLAPFRVAGPSTPLPAYLQEAGDAADRALWRDAVGEADESLWRAYRGCLVSSLAHDLSVMRGLGARPATVDHADIWRQSSRHARREVGRDRKSFGEHPPSISATGTLAGGGRYALAWHYLPDFPAYRETVRVVHGRGTVELTFPSPYLLHAPTELVVTTLDGDAEHRVVRRSVTEAFETQLEAFHAFVREGTPPRSGLAEGRADVLTCQQIVAAYAARTGTPVGGEVGRLVKERL